MTEICVSVLTHLDSYRLDWRSVIDSIHWLHTDSTELVQTDTIVTPYTDSILILQS